MWGAVVLLGFVIGVHAGRRGRPGPGLVTEALEQDSVAEAPPLAPSGTASSEERTPVPFEVAPVVERALRETGSGEWVLRGRVRDHEGRPIVGALVWAEGGQQVATSDDLGAFEVRAPAGIGEGEGEILLTTAEGFAAHRTLFVTGRTETIVLSRGSPFRARLLREGSEEPLAVRRLEVRAIWAGSKWFPTTDAGGRFSLWTTPGDLLEIRIPLAGSAPWSTEVAVLEDRDELDLYVPVATTRVTVLVTDHSTGAAIPRAEVSILGSTLGSTDLDGELEYEAFPEQADTLTFRAAGFCDAQIRREPGQDLVTIRLAPGARLFGVVLEEDGRPVPAARVQLSSIAPFGPSTHDVPDGLLGRTQVTSTDEHGAFSIGGLGTRRGVFSARLRVLAEGHAVAETEFSMTNGEERGPVTVTLVKGGGIRGRVTTGDEPAQASVFVKGAGAHEVHTDDDGFFVLEGLAAGPHEVVAYLDAFTHATASASVFVEPGVHVPCELRLHITLGALEGYVLTEGGRPVGDARILCLARGFHEDDPLELEARTEPSGRYRLDLPVSIDGVECRYDLFLLRWDGDGFRKDAPAEAQADLIVSDSARVRVCPVAAGTGQRLGTLGGVSLVWRTTGSKRHCWGQREVGAGVVEYEVPPGPATLELVAGSLRSEGLEIEASAGGELDLGLVPLR